MKRTLLKEELLKMRFQEVYGGWQESRLTQEEAAQILGCSERTFRRHCRSYEADGMEGLTDKRLHQISHRKAPVDEIVRLTNMYAETYQGWNVKHFYGRYQKDGGARSYSWVKNTLQLEQKVPKTTMKGKHFKKRERRPLPGMMIHQDASTHQWIKGSKWDLIVTMDDATNEHYSMFFAEQEGTMSSLQGIQDVIRKKGVFCSFYSDRGSHYWHTPIVGGKVDKGNPTQFGMAMKALNINMIAAYSPQARGRSERMFKTHQGRLPQELELAGIADMDAANDYIQNVYLPAFNAEFSRKASEEGTAFVAYVGGDLDDTLCETFERVVSNDNCVRFENMSLQIPVDTLKYHYVKAKVKLCRHIDATLSVWYGPRCLARYDSQGKSLPHKLLIAA